MCTYWISTIADKIGIVIGGERTLVITLLTITPFTAWLITIFGFACLFRLTRWLGLTLLFDFLGFRITCILGFT